MEHYKPKSNPVPDGLLTRNQGRERGLALKRNAEPVGFKINQNSHEPYYFYTEDSFRPKKILSDKQLAILAAGRKRRYRDGSKKFNKPNFDSNYVFLDTETTGLGDIDQIIEIAIVDYQGNTLINTRLKPTVEIDEDAQDVHGISIDELNDCPTWPDIDADVRAVLSGKHIVMFNAAFDLRMIRQTAKAFGCNDDWTFKLDTICAMYLAADCYGATNRYGTISLSTAADLADCEWHLNKHSALGDALTMLSLYKCMHEGT